MTLQRRKHQRRNDTEQQRSTRLLHMRAYAFDNRNCESEGERTLRLLQQRAHDLDARNHELRTKEQRVYYTREFMIWMPETMN